MRGALCRFGGFPADAFEEQCLRDAVLGTPKGLCKVVRRAHVCRKCCVSYEPGTGSQRPYVFLEIFKVQHVGSGARLRSLSANF